MQIFAELYEFNEQLILTLKFSRASMEKTAEPYRYVKDVINGKELLKGEDGQFLKDYILNLGKTDALSQVDYLNERKALLKKYKDESFADYKKYSSLYIKIFFSDRRYGCCITCIMDISIIFKIAAVGIIVTIICQVLKKSDRDDIATIVSLVGLIIVLTVVISMIADLFTQIRQLFDIF